MTPDLDPKALEAAHIEKVARAMYEHNPHKRQEPWEELIGGPDPYWMEKAKAAIDADDLVPRSGFDAANRIAQKDRDAAVLARNERDEARKKADELAQDLKLATDLAHGSDKLWDEQGRQLAAVREAFKAFMDFHTPTAIEMTYENDRKIWQRSQAALTDTAAAAAQYQRVPEGYVVVPVEPTEAMAEAWAALALDRIKRRMKDDSDCKGATEGAKESYKAMIAAAPNLSSVAEGEAGEEDGG